MIATGLALSMGSCSPNRPVDYRAYDHIPVSPVNTTFRFLARTNPLTSRAAFYGNYGGPGNSGGRPSDRMDELFRRHDIVYWLAKTRLNLMMADRELVEKLEELETRPLEEHGEKFRQRAIDFFGSPISRVIGKPVATFFRRREPPDSYFPNPSAVQEFFSESHSGMPGGGRDF